MTTQNIGFTNRNSRGFIPDFKVMAKWIKMRSEDTLLKKMHASHRSFIHPHGERATAAVISRISSEKGISILDFGCGSGASMIALHCARPESQILDGIHAN